MISHEWLDANIPMERRILQQWLKAGFIDQHVLHATVEGTPQGGPVSPVLMNLTLNGLERDLSHFLQTLKRKDREAAKVHLVRFADDFVRHEAQIEHGAQAPAAGRRAVSLSS
jgi:RNA-directed DNA polymerase